MPLYQFHSVRGYIAFERLVSFFEKKCTNAIPALLGYSKNAIEKRLVQRLIDLGLFPFVQECAKYHEKGDDLNLLENKNLNFDGIITEISKNKLRPTVKLWLRMLGEFLLHWLHVVLNVRLRVFNRNKGIVPATLLFGLGRESLYANESDSRFVKFCNFGPIKPLSIAHRLIVQTHLEIKSTEPNRFEYARFPLFQLLKESPLNFTDFSFFFINHFKVLFSYLYLAFRFPILSILGRDFAYHAILLFLNQKKQIENIIVTNANYAAQPLWMNSLKNRHYQTHMVWYSVNIIPSFFKDDPVQCHLPNYRHMRFDVAWVWTDAFAAFIKSLGVKASFQVVGPILWQLPVEMKPVENSNEITIVVFDITPVKNDVAKKIGAFRNYYQAENMIRFLRDILNVREQLAQSFHKKIRILLKHKREFNPRHDLSYISLVDEYRNSGALEIIPFDTNLYELLLRATVTIVIPYSSPAYIANYLKIPAIFYDPLSELLPCYENGRHISFVAGKQSLLQKIGEICQSKAPI